MVPWERRPGLVAGDTGSGARVSATALERAARTGKGRKAAAPARGARCLGVGTEVQGACSATLNPNAEHATAADRVSVLVRSRNERVRKIANN